jgi:hypothetical protein
VGQCAVAPGGRNRKTRGNKRRGRQYAGGAAQTQADRHLLGTSWTAKLSYTVTSQRGNMGSFLSTEANTGSPFAVVARPDRASLWPLGGAAQRRHRTRKCQKPHDLRSAPDWPTIRSKRGGALRTTPLPEAIEEGWSISDRNGGGAEKYKCLIRLTSVLSARNSTGVCSFRPATMCPHRTQRLSSSMVLMATPLLNLKPSFLISP